MNLTACVTLNTTQFIRLEELPLNHFQKPHQRKQGDHISCRGSPGIPLLLFLHSRSQVTHCFHWQDFQHWAHGLPHPFFMPGFLSFLSSAPYLVYSNKSLSVLLEDSGHHLIHSSLSASLLHVSIFSLGIIATYSSFHYSVEAFFIT